MIISYTPSNIDMTNTISLCFKHTEYVVYTIEWSK